MGLSVLAVFILVAIIGRIYTPHDPFATELYQKLIPPFWSDGGSTKNFLGTDSLGRDVFSRLLYGAAISLYIGFIATGINLIFGVPLGLIAGFFGGKADQIISRGVDIFLSIPSILLAIVIAAILGPSLENAMIAIGIVNIPHYVRVMRAQAIAEKNKEYIEAAKAIGIKPWTIMFKTLLPNCISPLIIQATLGFSNAILEAAALSFIGLGAQPPLPEWGAMLHDGKSYFHNAWWVMTFPGFAIFFAVLAFNLLGDGLRDVLDPRMKDG